MVQVTRSYKVYRPNGRHSSNSGSQIGGVRLIDASECNRRRCQEKLLEPFDLFCVSDKLKSYSRRRHRHQEFARHRLRSRSPRRDRHRGSNRYARPRRYRRTISSRIHKYTRGKDIYGVAKRYSHTLSRRRYSNETSGNSRMEPDGVFNKEYSSGQDVSINKECDDELHDAKQCSDNVEVGAVGLASPVEALSDEDDPLIQAMEELVAIVDGVEYEKRVGHIEPGDCTLQACHNSECTDHVSLMGDKVGNLTGVGIYAQQSMQYCINNNIGLPR